MRGPMEEHVKRFTVDEANALLPGVERRLDAARAELAPLQAAVGEANEELLAREWKMRQAREQGAPRLALDELQNDWDEAAAHLVACREHLALREKAWTRVIERMGVEVRDLVAGQVDFPAAQGDAAISYCWHRGEARIGYWHPHTLHRREARQPLERT